VTAGAALWITTYHQAAANSDSVRRTARQRGRDSSGSAVPTGVPLRRRHARSTEACTSGAEHAEEHSFPKDLARALAATAGTGTRYFSGGSFGAIFGFSSAQPMM
jgi:hypothetical protein